MWSGTGDRVMYMSQEKGKLDLFTTFADGSGGSESVLVDDKDKYLWDWSRDGRYVVYSRTDTRTSDLWIYSMERQESEPLLAGASTYVAARFSPDTSWIAYMSDDSGRMEVFVQAFDGDDGVKVGARWQLSTAGRQTPLWRDDGREIVYVDPQQRLMAVSVEERQGILALGAPRELFTVDGIIATGDATGDHERFLIATRDATGSEPLHVILNWPADL